MQKISTDYIKAKTSHSQRQNVPLHASTLPNHSTHSLIHPSQNAMRDTADISQNTLSVQFQATPNTAPDGISSIDGEDESKYPQRPSDLQLQETFPGIFDIPVAPFGEHAANREVDL